MLPSDFPKRGIVCYYYDVWSGKKKDGGAVLTSVLKKMIALLREDGYHKAKPTLGLIDAQSVKNASCAGEKGYDAGKKAGGIKRHIVDLFRNQKSVRLYG